MHWLDNQLIVFKIESGGKKAGGESNSYLFDYHVFKNRLIKNKPLF